MNILICNDDGIFSEGLLALANVLKKKHNIWIELYYICFVCFITVFSCYLIYYFCSSFYKMLNQFNNEFNWMMTGYSVIKLLVLVFLYLRMLQVIKRVFNPD